MPTYYTRKEVAKALGVSPWSVRRRGDRQIGKTILYRHETVEHMKRWFLVDDAPERGALLTLDQARALIVNPHTGQPISRPAFDALYKRHHILPQRRMPISGGRRGKPMFRQSDIEGLARAFDPQPNQYKNADAPKT